MAVPAGVDLAGLYVELSYVEAVGDAHGLRSEGDYFVRRVDGSPVVIDVRADARIEPKDVQAFEATRAACTQAG
ncbi:hypothetical protein [Streptomyces erythrochromogenes]|uniref:hypothetical protein n=1 Tax=Streptomyces erythrochromogenes TaxID=285574 RepID=UPI0036B3038D